MMEILERVNKWDEEKQSERQVAETLENLDLGEFLRSLAFPA